MVTQRQVICAIFRQDASSYKNLLPKQIHIYVHCLSYLDGNRVGARITSKGITSKFNVLRLGMSMTELSMTEHDLALDVIP